MPRTKYPVFKCLHRGEKGFTLVELLIVIAILGIVAAVVVPNISKFTDTGYVEAANAELDAVRTAVMGYYIDNNSTCPTIMTQLNAYLEGTVRCTYQTAGCSVNGTTPAGSAWGSGKIAWDTANSKWKAA